MFSFIFIGKAHVLQMCNLRPITHGSLKQVHKFFISIQMFIKAKSTPTVSVPRQVRDHRGRSLPWSKALKRPLMGLSPAVFSSPAPSAFAGDSATDTLLWADFGLSGHTHSPSGTFCTNAIWSISFQFVPRPGPRCPDL